jgi:bacteriorhodopsin
MAYDFFISWSMFPLLFVLGPEGFHHISAYSSVLAHEICDLFSKNLWTVMGHMLRVKVGRMLLGRMPMHADGP